MTPEEKRRVLRSLESAKLLLAYSIGDFKDGHSERALEHLDQAGELLVSVKTVHGRSHWCDDSEGAS